MPGDRVSGNIYSRCSPERFINMEGYMVGKKSCYFRFRRYWTYNGKKNDIRRSKGRSCS